LSQNKSHPQVAFTSFPITSINDDSNK
jgi:hypothetical protein